jgi:hypothetical protein
MSTPEQPGAGGTPAGWHDDPDDPTQLRYWDGQQWTDDRSPKGGQAGGAPVAAGQAGVQQKTNGMAVASLVLGILSAFLAILAIPGLIFGLMARSQIEQRPHETGAGMALAGIICSIVFGIIGVIVIITVYS